MAYLLNVVYLLIAALASPWLLYGALFQGKYRSGWRQKLWGLAPERNGNGPCIWIHAVSVGEVNLLGVLLKRLRASLPEAQIVVSTTTQTGYDLAKKKYAEHTVFFCPLDFSWAVKTALRRVRPDLMILAELEVWPNLLRYARRDGCPVMVVNGRLSDSSFRGYQRLGRFAQGMFAQLDLVAAQNDEYARRFAELGSPRVEMTGSLKFDGAQTDRQNEHTTRLRSLAGYRPDEVVFLAGSTQRGEEAMAIDVFRRLSAEIPQLRLAIAPRHPERFEEVAQLLEQSGLSWKRRSLLDDVPATASPPALLIDTVGELGAWWGAAHVAYVGGSMGSRGGQNMIEPAAYGAAVSFGPNTRNFRDVVALMLQAEAAVVVQEPTDLEAFVRRCLKEPTFAQELGARAKELVGQQLGAADRTLELIAERMQPTPAATRKAA